VRTAFKFANSTPCESPLKDQVFMHSLNRLVGTNLQSMPGVYDWLARSFDPCNNKCIITREQWNYACTVGYDIVGVLEKLLFVHGFQITHSRLHSCDLKNGFYFWSILALMGRWVTVLKYQKDYLFVRYARQSMKEYPEVPEDLCVEQGRMVFGRMHRFLTARLSGRKAKNLEFLNSVLQGLKKGMLPVDDATVIAAAHKHKKILSARKETPPTLIREVRRTAREVLGHLTLRDLKVPFNATLSDHGCVESTRQNGGILGHVLRNVSVIERNSREMVGLYEKGLKYEFIYVPVPLIAERFTELLYDAVYQEMSAEVRVKFILEPLKVRTISCGSAIAYAPTQAIQKWMWGKLQGFAQFHLTGETVDRRHINALLLQGSVGDVCVSGDYSAATDNLHLDVTLACIEEMCSANSPGVNRIRNIVLRALGPQGISYFGKDWVCKASLKDRKGELPSSFMQMRGQLMGSPLSFPILCIINAAILRHTYEVWNADGKPIAIKDLPALFNGDDVLFTCDERMYGLWRWIITQVGFLPSVGKNFVSRDFANINSTYYQLGKLMDGPVAGMLYAARQIGYVNMGLVMGRGKGDTLDETVGKYTGDERIAKAVDVLLCGRQSIEKLTESLTPEVARRAEEAWIREREATLRWLPLSKGPEGYNICVHTPEPEPTKLEAWMTQLLAAKLRKLRKSPLPADCLYYLPMYKHLRGEVDLDEASTLIKRARRVARRNMDARRPDPTRTPGSCYWPVERLPERKCTITGVKDEASWMDLFVRHEQGYLAVSDFWEREDTHIEHVCVDGIPCC